MRWQLADRSTIDRPAAWLTTVAGRIGLDRLRARQRERAEYVGPWLPEPLVIAADHSDPAHAAELSDSLTTAFLLVLEQLDPVERLVVLLADVFDQPFSAVAEVTGKAEPACRQIAVRARRKIRSTGSGHVPSGGADARRLANDFAAAALTGDVPALLELLAPDVVLVSDGGRERHAARRPVVGPAPRRPLPGQRGEAVAARLHVRSGVGQRRPGSDRPPPWRAALPPIDPRRRRPDRAHRADREPGEARRAGSSAPTGRPLRIHHRRSRPG